MSPPAEPVATPVPAEGAAATLDVLARYAQVADTRAWDHLHDVFTEDATVGGAGLDSFTEQVLSIEPYHPGTAEPTAGVLVATLTSSRRAP